MRILFLGKRHPQQRDLVERPYGRFFHVPVGLAARGHEVRTLLCSHRRLPALEVERAGVAWSSLDVRTLGVRRYLRQVTSEASAFRPDWIVGVSDAWYGWLARKLSQRVGARLAVDAYDNYEAYMPWNLPLHWQWRRAIRDADCVTAAGPQLASLLNRQRRGRTPAAVVPMAADPAFVPRDRGEARATLGLPDSAALIGYSGSWARNRGTDVLLRAFRLLRERSPAAQLVLTGRPPAHALAEPGVITLGYLPDAQLPLALSALDVACVITANTAFGRYSYPAKLCEAMACGIPVVATATAPVRWMLHDDARSLVPIDDAHALADRLLAQLHAEQVTYPNLPSWAESAERFETALASVSP
ncbi:MAG TPA: glycosyltransferase [Rhodanobacteraceae bacterium]|nr:glycosyltransferase [Rhodanobacteraceae bacterium]